MSRTQLIHLRRFMANRRFVAARTELLAEGFTPSRIKNWLHDGRLVPVVRGVYSYGRDVETTEAIWRAALLAAGPGSALTGFSSCELWGLRKCRTRLPKLIEIAVPTGEARTLGGLSPATQSLKIHLIRRTLERGDIRTKDGLPLTKPPVALMDLAVNASDREVSFAFLEACRLGLFGREDVSLCFRRVAGRRGASSLRPLLNLWFEELNRIRSVFEGLFLLEWVERDLPMPRVNVRVGGFEADLYWPEPSLVLELDGAAFHRGRVQKRIDAAKQRHLEGIGLTVLRINYAEFDADPAGVIARIASHL